jgi:hypothetical protein
MPAETLTPTRARVCSFVRPFLCYVVQCALSREKVSGIARDYPVFGQAMANLVRIFSKKMSSKNPEVDLDLIIKALLESQQKDDEDDEYTHKVHLSDVMKEIKFQVRRHDTSQDTAGPPSKLALYRYPLPCYQRAHCVHARPSLTPLRTNYACLLRDRRIDMGHRRTPRWRR